MARKTLMVVIAGMVATALVVGLKRRFSDDSARQAHEVEQLSGGISAPSGPHPTPINTESAGGAEDSWHERNAFSLVEIPDRTVRSLDSPQPYTADIREEAAQDPPPRERGTDISVVGRPFPVSPSVAASCRAISGGGDDACDSTWEPLKKMAQEPRSSAWAKEMESMLRDHIAQVDPGKYTIRALECRTSVCVIEVESIFGPYFGSFDHDAPLFKVLYPGIGAHGYESNPDATRITVTVMPYTRD